MRISKLYKNFTTLAILSLMMTFTVISPSILTAREVGRGGMQHENMRNFQHPAERSNLNHDQNLEHHEDYNQLDGRYASPVVVPGAGTGVEAVPIYDPQAVPTTTPVQSSQPNYVQ